MLTDVVAASSGVPADYLSAFKAIDELISNVARVISHLIVMGPPEDVGAVTEGVWHQAPYGMRVRLVAAATGTALMFGPTIVRVTSPVPGLGGLVAGHSTSVNIPSRYEEGSAAMEGLMLPDSDVELTAGPARPPTRPPRRPRRA